jgi:anti-anti-sigma factor
MSDELATMRLDRSEGSLVVHVSGEIDLSNAQELHRQLESRIGSHSRVIVNLADVEYLDSQGLRLIMQLCSKVDRDQTELSLVAPPGGVARQVLELARMHDYVEIRDALED